MPACIALALITGSWTSHAQIRADKDNSESNYEPELLTIVDLIQEGKLQHALSEANQHVVKYPKSKLGHLLKADILQAMSVELDTIGQNVSPDSEPLLKLKHQLKNRWESRGKDTRNLFPASLIDMGSHPHVLVADMSAGRLFLYQNRNEQPYLVKDYYMSVGSAGFGKEVEGDNKTPVGVYSIYKHIKSDELPDLYGEGAFPVDYPNRFDRSLKRTGYGIWLHGTPSNTYARAPWASEGCFVLSNDDLLDIENYIDIESRTPVVLTDKIEWVNADTLNQEKQKYLRILQTWKSDWESLDTEIYAKHYSQENFNFGSNNFSTWLARKREVNDGKTFVQVDLDIESLFVYPGADDMFLVRYTQHYLSNNYSGKASKEQYWKRDESGTWKIVYEG
jgi:murein L,D-transpeptidase YafK